MDEKSEAWEAEPLAQGPSESQRCGEDLGCGLSRYIVWLCNVLYTWTWPSLGKQQQVQDDPPGSQMETDVRPPQEKGLA